MNRLAGQRVLVTRPRDQAEALSTALAARGARAVLFPTIEVRPAADLSRLDRAIDTIETYDWIAFPSPNAVAVVFDRSRTRSFRLPPRLRIAAVGPGTAHAITAHGAAVDFIPSQFLGEQLGRELAPVEGLRVLIPRAARGREELAIELAHRGARVDEVVVYDTLPASVDPRELRELERGVDVATFTSPSTVENFFALLGARAVGVLGGACVACIGPVTAAAARTLGLTVHLEPAEHSIPGLVAALDAADPT
ncbi:MAG TPA: uroporphyrinogen-III synthase [Gemmatimonadales bacterium]|nr:uroporphyrinogen-III synthase [Gemmatimonadales bacterium]